MRNRVAYCGFAGAILVISIGYFLDDPFPNHLAPTIWLGVFYLVASALLFVGTRLETAIGATGVAVAAVMSWQLHFHPVTVLELCGAVLFLVVPMFSESDARKNT